MRWIPTPSGRFPKRLHFDEGELDTECERLVQLTCFRRLKRDFAPPLDDDTLQVLMEAQADLDLYAELRPDVDGVTDFRPDERPLVKINVALTAAPERRNRARTTLAHEWFHAVYHRPAWQLRWAKDAAKGSATESHACSKDDIVDPREDNWLEFQAAYASCAILMPRLWARRVVDQFLETDPLSISAVVDHVARTFDVSREAAGWRLRQLKLAAGLKHLRQETLWDRLR